MSELGICNLNNTPHIYSCGCIDWQPVNAHQEMVQGEENMVSLGKVAYDAYFNNSGGKSLVSGAALPAWEDQSEEIKAAWDAAAQAVIEKVS